VIIVVPMVYRHWYNNNFS